jgi:hypothetical protein
LVFLALGKMTQKVMRKYRIQSIGFRGRGKPTERIDSALAYGCMRFTELELPLFDSAATMA